MLKRLIPFFMIMTVALLTLNLSTPVSAAVSTPIVPRPNHPKGFSIQSVTEGQNVMWLMNPASTTVTGVQFNMSVAISMDIHNNFAPWETGVYQAVRPPNGACIEIFTDHFRDSSNVMHATFNLWSWCSGLPGGFYYGHAMDTAWWTKYTQTASWHNWAWDNNVYYNDKTILAKIEKINPVSANCWQAKLWNYTTSAWEAQGSPSVVCGTPNDPDYPVDGWESIEEHYASNTVCGNLGFYNVMQTRNTKVQRGVGAGYVNLDWTPDYSDAPATRCQPAPWHAQYEQPYVGHPGAGIILCDPFLQPNCD